MGGDDNLTFDDNSEVQADEHDEEEEDSEGPKAEIREEEVSNSMMLFFTVASGSISACYR